MAESGRPKGAQRDPDEGFLRRWSRRKAEAQRPETPPAVAASDGAEPALASPQMPEPAASAPAPIDPKDLPDIDSLDAGSDFTVFMRPGVPEQLRIQALRKLWRSDPIFSKLDGLVEYGEDYTIPSWPKGVVQTAYRIGRGFVDELEKLGEADAESVTPDEPATGPEPEAGPARIAATPAEPARPQAAAARESGRSQQAAAQPAKRRRRLPAKS